MSAIRFRYNGASQVIALNHRDQCDWVIIRLHGGKEQRIRCVGFVCTHATELMPHGSHTKILAMSVTADDNPLTNNWTDLKPHEAVLGWRVLESINGQSKWSVYIIVSDFGLPLVVTDMYYKPPPGPELAGVSYLSDRRRKGAGKAGEGKRA